MSPIIESVSERFESASAPVAGTDNVQTLTITGIPTGGVFQLGWEGFKTADLAYNADSAAVQAALRLLPNIGVNVTVTGDAPHTVTFITGLGKRLGGLVSLAKNGLTGGTVPTIAVVNTTPGVDATCRGCGKGKEVVALDTGILYINTGTALAPTWTKVGAQT